jgi:hypothetical protein
MSAMDPATFAARFPDLPPLGEVGTAWSGVKLLGFPSSGSTAVDQWHGLYAAHHETGLYPVLLPPDFFRYGGDARSAEDVIAAADQLDGAAILARLQAYQERLLAAARQRTGSSGEPHHEEGWEGIEVTEDDYPGPLGRDVVRLAIGREWLEDGTVRPVAYDVLVALVECTEPWQVFAHLGFDNEALLVVDHVAVLRQLFDSYQAVPATLSGTGLELVLGKPPATDEEALAAAGLYLAYNDGAYDNYLSSTQQNLAGKLKDNTVWAAWWD